MHVERRLILALDVTERERALSTAGTVAPFVDAIKVNYPLVLSCGMGIVKDLSRIGKVICDFKVADIPNTNRLISREVSKSGASGIIVHGFVGEDAVSSCVESFDGDVFVVTEMSHPGGRRFTSPIADELALLAVRVGAAGIIAPATRPERISHLRRIVGDLLILSPGVGAQGGSARQAIEAGADSVIVGRSIYDSPSPAAAAEGILKSMEGAKHR